LRAVFPVASLLLFVVSVVPSWQRHPLSLEPLLSPQFLLKHHQDCDGGVYFNGVAFFKTDFG